MKHYIIILAILFAGSVFGQEAITQLNHIDDLLNESAKRELSTEINDKDMVFLGESEHHIGSDFKAKTQFVKFLVLEHGFKNIAFEADFFALHFTNDKEYLWPFWSKSTQCSELFAFLKEHQVTIWGFDSQFSSAFSFQNFSPKLFTFLDQSKISYDSKFKESVDFICSEGSELKRKLSKKDIASLIEAIDHLAANNLIRESGSWQQFLKSFKSMVLQYTSPKSEGYKIRDIQMAENLDYIAKTLDKQKIIVWAANAHISKSEEDFMEGKIMGSKFLELSNRKTFHIAFSPIKMPYRKTNFLQSQSSDPNNLLNLLPSITNNSIIFSNVIKRENPKIVNRKFTGMFGMGDTSFDYFKHFDALVFIGQGEKVSY